ncbi:CDP-glycerol glycerophosphotransferase family protein [Enterobacillus tribolii]|uniref:CDP-glycerol glycerophosphotransferase n=1 Tax=Enterobacillus tribolii TaxID=1487935 RepID=A0A370R2M3_9GAMM|nr:CDP-glycerol glycerophosphotransferase family protein [Enterobacillus tribolii]RDK96691.1 CDP-glycerol glycerophosphotransferase [Enterobacillus tribolii]
MYYIVSIILTCISYFVPVNKNLYIAGSWFGRKFSDNPKYFYKYVLDSQEQKTIYWYTRDRLLYNEMRLEGLPVLYGNSIKSIIMHLRASAVFCSCSPKQDLLGVALNNKTIVFNLWHGTPMKKIGFDCISSGVGISTMGLKDNKNALEKLLRQYFYSPLKKFVEKKTYILSPSDEISKILCGAFKKEEQDILSLGYPKLDHLIKTRNSNQNKKAKIFYAPTYRGEYDSECNILVEYGFVIDDIDVWLRGKDYYLEIQLHPANRLPNDFLQKINKTERIQVVSYPDIYEILNQYQYVITDFSSIYFDAISVGIKTIIAPFGLESYLSNDRQLYFSIEELFPYALSKNWPELIKNFETYYNLPEISFVLNRFYKYQDGDSCRRLMLAVEKIIGK